MKATTIKFFEFNRALHELINDAGVPAFVIEFALKDAIAAVHVAAEKQLASDLAAYKSELEKEKLTGGRAQE